MNMTDATDLENELETPTEETPVEDAALDASAAADFDALASEIAKLKDTAARAQADYKNLLARTERERVEMSGYVTEKVVGKFLPSIDNLERLLAGTPESDRSGALYEGVKSTLSGLSKALESAGITAFESVGSPLDPSLHEAIVRMPGTEGAVVAEFEKGYRLGDRVVRHAKVAVGDGTEPAGTSAE